MIEDEYLALTNALTRDLAIGIKAFCASPTNRSVCAMALAYYYDGDLPMLCINNEDHAAAMEHQQITSRGKMTLGVQRERFSAYGFPYVDDRFYADETRAMFQRARNFFDSITIDDEGEWLAWQYARFERAVCDAIIRLEVVISRLDRTENFISYAWIENVNGAHTLRLYQATVSPVLLDRALPELRRQRELLERVALLPKAQQATIWAKAIEELFDGSANEWAKEVEQCDLCQHDLVHLLYNVGVSALPIVLKMIERHAYKQVVVMSQRRSKQALDPMLVHSERIAHCMVFGLGVFEHLPASAIARLTALGQWLFADDAPRAIAGTLCQVLARNLHVARPDLYPYNGKFSQSTNHLLNPQDFGFFQDE